MSRGDRRLGCANEDCASRPAGGRADSGRHDVMSWTCPSRSTPRPPVPPSTSAVLVVMPRSQRPVRVSHGQRWSHSQWPYPLQPPADRAGGRATSHRQWCDGMGKGLGRRPCMNLRVADRLTDCDRRLRRLRLWRLATAARLSKQSITPAAARSLEMRSRRSRSSGGRSVDLSAPLNGPTDTIPATGKKSGRRGGQDRPIRERGWRSTTGSATTR